MPRVCEKYKNSELELGRMKSETQDHVPLEVHGLIVLHPDYLRHSAIMPKRDLPNSPIKDKLQHLGATSLQVEFRL
jgi:hypothetical protein